MHPMWSRAHVVCNPTPFSREPPPLVSVGLLPPPVSLPPPLPELEDVPLLATHGRLLAADSGEASFAAGAGHTAFSRSALLARDAAARRPCARVGAGNAGEQNDADDLRPLTALGERMGVVLIGPTR